MKKLSQKGEILNHLKKHGKITSMDAFRLYNITRLAARISDLRNDGHPINTTKENPKDVHATYTMAIGPEFSVCTVEGLLND